MILNDLHELNNPLDCSLNGYHPQDCLQLESGQVAMTDTAGVLKLSGFPDDPQLCGQDWALKIKRVEE
ncbi:MAG: hypothetical protein U5R06_19705 [candidate division KSB1 bacterium]|nr:hypothetical protein [candidate division KSB1 bacterium]